MSEPESTSPSPLEDFIVLVDRALQREPLPEPDPNIDYHALAREVAEEAARRGLTDLMTRPDVFTPSEDHEQSVLAKVRQQIQLWVDKVPSDDWGDDVVDTVLADAGRHLLAIMDGTAPVLDHNGNEINSDTNDNNNNNKEQP